MSFCRKIYDRLNALHQGSLLCHKHLADMKFLVLTDLTVDAVVFRKRFPKLQSNAFSHHSDSIDSIDQGISLTFQQISFYVMYHQK